VVTFPEKSRNRSMSLLAVVFDFAAYVFILICIHCVEILRRMLQLGVQTGNTTELKLGSQVEESRSPLLPAKSSSTQRRTREEGRQPTTGAGNKPGAFVRLFIGREKSRNNRKVVQGRVAAAKAGVESSQKKDVRTQPLQLTVLPSTKKSPPVVNTKKRKVKVKSATKKDVEKDDINKKPLATITEDTSGGVVVACAFSILNSDNLRKKYKT